MESQSERFKAREERRKAREKEREERRKAREKAREEQRILKEIPSLEDIFPDLKPLPPDFVPTELGTPPWDMICDYDTLTYHPIKKPRISKLRKKSSALIQKAILMTGFFSIRLFFYLVEVAIVVLFKIYSELTYKQPHSFKEEIDNEKVQSDGHQARQHSSVPASHVCSQ